MRGGEATTANRYYYWPEGEPVIGPVTPEELERLRRAGILGPRTRIAHVGALSWEALSQRSAARWSSPTFWPPPLPLPSSVVWVAVLHMFLGLLRGAILPIRFMTLLSYLWITQGGVVVDGPPLIWRLFDLFLEVLMACWLLMGGLALVQRRPAGPALAISAAMLMLVRVLVAFVIKTVVYAHSGHPPTAPLQIPISLMVGLLYPLVSLLLLNRPSVRRLFEP